MTLRTLFLAALLAAATAHASDSPLAERARQAMAAVPADQIAHGALLESYADSLQTIDPVLSARCLEKAGIAAFRANDLDTAIDRWQRGLDLARDADELTAESSLLNALAIGYSVNGEVERALPVYERSLEVRETLGDTLGMGRVWGNLANAYTEIGRTAEALAASAEQEAWLALKDNPFGRMAVAIRRTTLLGGMSRHEEAVIAGRHAVALADSLGDDAQHATAGMTLGGALLDAGRYDEAVAVLTDARLRLEAAGDAFTAAFARQNLAIALLQLGRHEDALAESRSLLADLDESDSARLTTVMKRCEGNALFALGRLDEAEAALTEAMELFERRRDGLDDERSRTGIFQINGEVYASLAVCRLAVGDTAGAFAYVERGRAPAFRDRTGAGAVGPDELQPVLAARDAALVLFSDPTFDPLVAFILDARGLRAVELGPAGPLAADARAALRLLAAGETLDACRPVLYRLSVALSGPVLAAVAPEVERFCVVPPSFLAGFPLGVLEDRDGREWSRVRALSYLPNASSLLELKDRVVPDGGIMAFADPETGDLEPRRLPDAPSRAMAGIPLPEARREVAAVTARDADRRVGPEATAAALRSALSVPTAVLHLATHAVVDPVDGGRSSVVLAGPDGPEPVTAREIADTRFQGDLVVLSGCSTFGGHRVLGEGWFGLPRSFLAAGARTVLSTLWDVEDRGARVFVTAFYDALADGADRDQALAIAREHCRAEGMPPREWAAFVLTGVGDVGVVLDGGKGPGRALLFGGILVIVALTTHRLWNQRARELH